MEKQSLSPITALARDQLFWHICINQCAKSNGFSDAISEFDPDTTLIHYKQCD